MTATPIQSILPPAPAGTAHRPESYSGEDYVSVGAFAPGEPRNLEHGRGVGSIFLDADAADWYLHECVALDSPGIGDATADAAKDEIKVWLHDHNRTNRLPQDKLDAILDAHLARVQEVLGWLGLTATHIVRSGYGHHVHIWLDRWHDDARDFTGAVIERVEKELGYALFDRATNLGAPQLCRDLGMVNNKGRRSQPVRRVGGNPDHRMMLGDFAAPPAPLAGAGAVRQHVQDLHAVLKTLAPKKGSGGTAGKASGAKGNHGTMAADTQIDTPSHGTGTLGALAAGLAPGAKTYIPAYCPHHKHTDNKHNASIRVNDAGTPYLHCFSQCGGKTWWSSSVSPTNFRQQGKVESKDKNVRTFTKVTEYTPGDLTAGKYLPLDRTTARVTYLRTPKGSGKTELAAYAAGLMRAAGKRVVAVAHLRSLVGGLASRLRLPDYREVEPGRIEGSVAVCLNSLHRVQLLAVVTGEVSLAPSVYPIDLLFIDEVEQCISAIHGGTMDALESLRAYNRLVACIRAARRIVVADADLSERAVDFVRDALGWTEETPDRDEELRVVSVPSPWTYSTTLSRAYVDAEVLRAWKAGEKLAIPMMASADCHTVAEMLRREDPNREVVVVAGDTIKRLEKSGRPLAKINEWVKDVDALVFSPSMGTGVSMDVPNHFDRVIAYGYASVGTAMDMHQMLHRVRAPKSQDIIVWLSPAGSQRPTNEKVIRHHVLLAAAATKKLVAPFGEVEDYDLVGLDAGGKVVFEHPDHADLYVRNLAYQRRHGGGGGRIADAFPAYLKANGYKHIDLDATGKTDLDKDAKKNVSSKRKAGREEAEDARAARIAAAPDMSIEDARAIDEPASQDDADAIEKAEIVHHYGDATVDTIKRDKRGKRRAQSRRYAEIQAELNGHREANARRDLHDVRGGSAAHLRHRTLRARLVASILAWYGVRDALKNAGCHSTSVKNNPPGSAVTPIDPTRLEPAVKKVLANKVLIEEVLGISVRSDIASNPVQFLTSVLGQMGINTCSRQRREQGERVRDYWIDDKSLSAIHADASRYYERLIDARKYERGHGLSAAEVVEMGVALDALDAA